MVDANVPTAICTESRTPTKKKVVKRHDVFEKQVANIDHV